MLLVLLVVVVLLFEIVLLFVVVLLFEVVLLLFVVGRLLWCFGLLFLIGWLLCVVFFLSVMWSSRVRRLLILVRLCLIRVSAWWSLLVFLVMWVWWWLSWLCLVVMVCRRWIEGGGVDIGWSLVLYLVLDRFLCIICSYV